MDEPNKRRDTITNKRQRDLDLWFAQNPNDAVAGIYHKDREKRLGKYLYGLHQRGHIGIERMVNTLRKNQKTGQAMAYVPHVPEIFGKDVPLPVVVAPLMYRTHTKPQVEFLLQYHEFQHAEDHVRGIRLYDGTMVDAATVETANPKLLHMLLESRALLCELTEHLRRGETSSDEFKSAQTSAFNTTDQFWRIRGVNTSIDFSILQDRKRAFYEFLPELPGFRNYSFPKR